MNEKNQIQTERKKKKREKAGKEQSFIFLVSKGIVHKEFIMVGQTILHTTVIATA
jgi:hypothetical protein